MRYPRGIKKFLIPSIIFHLLIISLLIFLFKSSHDENKLSVYEIGLIKITGRNKNNNKNPNKTTDKKQDKQINNSQSKTTVTQIKPRKISEMEKKESTIIIENNRSSSVNSKNHDASGYSTSRSLPGNVSPANTYAQQAHPDYDNNPKPDYPLMARRRGYEGTVLIRVKVLKNGKVGQIDLEKSSQYEILDKSALNAVSNWTFIPEKRNGKSVSSWVTVPVRFELKGG